MDTMNRASFCTFSTVGALFRIDMRTVIFHCNRAELADTLTLFAANTAIGADLSGIHSLVLVHTSNICLLASWEKLQNRIRANPCASTAANALILINFRNVIHNMNRIVRWCSRRIPSRQNCSWFFHYSKVLLPCRSWDHHNP